MSTVGVRCSCNLQFWYNQVSSILGACRQVACMLDDRLAEPINIRAHHDAVNDHDMTSWQDAQMMACTLHDM